MKFGPLFARLSIIWRSVCRSPARKWTGGEQAPSFVGKTVLLAVAGEFHLDLSQMSSKHVELVGGVFHRDEDTIKPCL